MESVQIWLKHIGVLKNVISF